MPFHEYYVADFRRCDDDWQGPIPVCYYHVIRLFRTKTGADQVVS